MSQRCLAQATVTQRLKRILVSFSKTAMYKYETGQLTHKQACFEPLQAGVYCTAYILLQTEFNSIADCINTRFVNSGTRVIRGAP